MNLTPRQLYRKNIEESAWLAQTLVDPRMMKAISATLAEMAARNMAPELSGANWFLSVLKSLAEEDKEVKREPDPALKSYGM